jgi:hypothetical protein
MRRPALLALLLCAAASLAGCGGSSGSVSGAQCLAWLDAHRVAYTAVDIDETKDSRCRVAAAVRISRVEAALNHPATMSCFLAARLDAFERDVVPRLAAADLGQRVARIEHLGAYSCRSISGRHDRLSEHAFGLAIDISGFRLADGSLVSVERDWWKPGRKRDFLRHLARSACGYFSVVLTPDSNRDHYNHMHFDIGPDRLCSV